MKTTLESFYKAFFLKTDGFMLNLASPHTMRIGDLFTISKNQFSVFNNIYDATFALGASHTKLQPNESPSSIALNDSKGGLQTWQPSAKQWQLLEECQSSYHAKAPNVASDGSNLNLFTATFKSGGHFFTAQDIQCSRMPHFYDIHQEILIKLFQQVYTLNNCFLITEIAQAKTYSLGVCSDKKGIFKATVEDFQEGSLNDLLHSDSYFDVQQVKGMHPLRLRTKGGSLAFKAKKVQLTAKARDHIMAQLLASGNEVVQRYLSDSSDALAQFLPRETLNVTNVGDFFEWTDFNLNDMATFVSH